MKNTNSDLLVRRFSFTIALATALLTLVTFVIAVSTPPLSGPFCRAGCFEYPFHDVASRFPRDYYWMFPGMVLAIVSLALLAVIHHHAHPGRRVFSGLGLAFGAISTAILFTDYFVQVTVIQPSLIQGEFDGIALLSQYNPHGLFIALEEVGYLMLNVAFFVMVPVFQEKTGVHRTIRIAGIIGFAAAIISLVYISITLGLQREYVFEVVIILIVWLQLSIISFALTRQYFSTFRDQTSENEFNT